MQLNDRALDRIRSTINLAARGATEGERIAAANATVKAIESMLVDLATMVVAEKRKACEETLGEITAALDRFTAGLRKAGRGRGDG